MSVVRSSLARLLAANLIALAVFAVCGGVILEIFCRVVVDDGARFDFEMWRYARALKVATPDRDLPFVHRPNAAASIMGVDVRTNSIGLRESRELAIPKPAATLRILMLGDSVTFGFGVAENDTVTRRVEALLNVSGRLRVEAINAGVGNYNTVMEVAAYLKTGRTLTPDVVVLNFFVNDAEATPRPHGNPLSRHSLAAVYFSSQLDTFLRWVNGAPGWREYYAGLFEDSQPGWQHAQAAIAALAEACAADGRRLAIVDYPDLHQTDPYPLQVVTDRVKAVAGRHGLPFLDLTPEISGEQATSLWVNAGDPHPNGYTTAKYAKRIANWLEREILPGVLEQRVNERANHAGLREHHQQAENHQHENQRREPVFAFLLDELPEVADHALLGHGVHY